MSKQTLSPFVFDITPSSALTELLDTATLFNLGASHSLTSPVDRFIENSNKLSMLYTTAPLRNLFTPELGAVLLLGHVSAVESYMRGMIRGLIHIDERSEKLVAPKQLSYFAASHSEKNLLPEALLESISFSSAYNVSFTLKEFCNISGMSNGDVPKELKPVFKKFGDICQLRHCCVHRFGLLGAGNAHKLGIPKNSPLIEKPLVLTVDVLEDISSILQKFVLSLNSYLHRDVLQRTFMKSPLATNEEHEWHYTQQWAMDYRIDQQRFDAYHELFSITGINPPSMSAVDTYNLFLAWMKQSHSDIQKIKANKAKGGHVSGGTSSPLAQTVAVPPTNSLVSASSPQPIANTSSVSTAPVRHISWLSKLGHVLCNSSLGRLFKT